jgi:hypothetical protein
MASEGFEDLLQSRDVNAAVIGEAAQLRGDCGVRFGGLHSGLFFLAEELLFDAVEQLGGRGGELGLVRELAGDAMAGRLRVCRGGVAERWRGKRGGLRPDNFSAANC